MSEPGAQPDQRLYTSLSRIESSTVDRQLLEEGYYRKDKEEGLTIFLPNFNHRAFLPRALRSTLDALEILEEQGFAAEVLVIDDASRDGSQKLLRTVQATYNESRLKTLCLSRNYGHVRLLNLALRMSRFQHVLRMDADDEVVPANLPLFLRGIQQTGAAMVYGNVLRKQDDEIIGLWSHMPATMSITESNYIHAISLVDAERILGIGGFTRVHPYTPEDWEMVLHLIAEEEELVFVPAVLGYYYEHPLSLRQELRQNRGQIAALRRIYAQTGGRTWDNLQVGRIYHPDVGYVDEW